MNSMTKNRTAHTLGNGIRTTASGYAMNASPAPLCITSSTETPIWRARNPMIEKMTRPAKTDVAKFVKVTNIASLKKWMKERGKKKRKKKKGKKGKPPRQSLSLVCFVHEKKDSRIHRAARMKKPYIFVRNDKTIDLSAIEGDPRFRTDFEPSGLLNFQDRHTFPRGKDIYIYIYMGGTEGRRSN